MIKNVILSVVVLVVIIAGGYYLLSPSQSANQNAPVVERIPVENVDSYNQTAPIIQTQASTTATTNTIISKTSNMITLETNYGKIVFETYNQDAPKTVENFITLTNKGYYNGLTFHRVIKGFMIQGGDPTGNGTGGPGYKFEDELNPNTTSYKAGYKKGVVAMANAGPNTNGSQFFIMTADYPLPNNYTIFGKVVSGQDVVDKIAAVKTGANDMPVEPVVMKTVKAK